MAKASEKKSNVIYIPPMKRGAARVTIRGLEDLIVHAWSEKAKAEMRGKQKKEAKKAREKRDPKAEFEAAKYIEDGKDCLLSAALKKSIVNASRNLDGIKMTEIRQQIFVRGERIPIEYRECEMREDMVRVASGGADLRYRPGYKDWSATFEIEWDAGVLEINQVLHLVQVAGFSVGIHDWRPEKNGDFGRFELVSAEATGRAGDEIGQVKDPKDAKDPKKAEKAA